MVTKQTEQKTIYKTVDKNTQKNKNKLRRNDSVWPGDNRFALRLSEI